MTEETIRYLISTLTVIVSVGVSIFVTWIKNKADLARIKTELEQKYSKTLFDKRVELYPQLYSLITSFGKLMQYKSVAKDDLIELRAKIDDCDNKCSIFFTQPTRRMFGSFRKFLIRLTDNDNLNEAYKKELYEYFVVIERSLRTELGIYDTTAAGKIEAFGKTEMPKVFDFDPGWK